MAEPFFLLDKLEGLATVTSAPAALPGTLAANMLRHEPGMVFRTGAGTAGHLIEIIIDAGRLIDWDTFAVLGSNTRPGDSVALYASAADPAVPATAPNLQFALTAEPARVPDTGSPPKVVKTRLTTASHRYFRLQHLVGVTNHPDGYQQIGTVLIGKRFSFGQDMDVNASAALADPSPIVEGPGFEDADRYAPLPNWRVSFSYVPDVLWWEFYGFLRRAGETRRVLFVPEPERPERYHETVTFGRLKQVSGRHPVYNGWQAEVNVLGAQP